MPRTHWLSIEVELTLPEEVDVLLWLALDNTLAAYRPLLFRTAVTVPPAL